MNKVILKIGGMSCSGCAAGLEKYLNKQKGVESASVNLVLAQSLINYDDTLTIEDLERFVSEAGFESLGVYDEKEEKTRDIDKNKLIIFGILSLLTLYISMAHMIKLPSIPFLDMMKNKINYSVVLFILASIFIYYGIDIIRHGIKNLIHKMPNMDTLVTLGVFTSFIYSTYNMIMVILGHNEYINSLYFESVVIVIYFIKLGRYIDNKSKEKTKEAIKGLVQITPSNALLKTKDGEKIVTIDEVKKGDTLICKPGMKIAVDGVIKTGEAHFDEAFITGEAMSNKKKKGDKVIAGAINYDGYIEYTAEKIGKNSTISEIVRLVVEASNTKAPIAYLADKVSGIFVPTIMLIAILTFIFYLIFGFTMNDAIISFVTVLVVACPCALGLSTPLSLVISEGVCAKNGILVKNNETLENASKVDTIVFDKTGTLTYGNLKISKIYNYSNYSDKDLIGMVSSIESNSTHPISKAFKDYSKDKRLVLSKVNNFENISGIGLYGKIGRKEIYVGNNKLISKLKINNEYLEIENKLSSDGNTIIYVIENKKIIGLIGVKDVIRDNAKMVIKVLKTMGKEIILLTGDNEINSKLTSEYLKIDNVISNVLPKEKTEVITSLINEGKTVMMVGDGINDAPSLAVATIGVSMNGGTDIAADSSDVILMQDNLEKIIDLITISKRTITNIKQNLFWAFFYNILMIPLAVGLFKGFGLSLNPMIAGISMTISSITVVFNALRLRKIKC